MIQDDGDSEFRNTKKSDGTVSSENGFKSFFEMGLGSANGS